MIDEKVKVGKIVTTHGVKGEVKVVSLTEFEERFCSGEELYIENEIFTIEKSRPHKNQFCIKFSGYDNINEVTHLVNKYLEINKTDVKPLPEGKFYVFDLEGCKVYTDAGEYLGVLTSVKQTGSNDVYVVKGEKEYLIPALKKVVKKVDTSKKQIIITPMEGLLD
ncbi:ribosome maturation factor RimM [Proteinivorax hydrogeniformans]|uniref:Ribosome maturation factor RimM n=1 Tax=Proteinivorax hydrogeniformans TaxID=1826727 RepID=A0AAU8HQQ4_9FIRM